MLLVSSTLGEDGFLGDAQRLGCRCAYNGSSRIALRIGSQLRAVGIDTAGFLTSLTTCEMVGVVGTVPEGMRGKVC